MWGIKVTGMGDLEVKGTSFHLKEGGAYREKTKPMRIKKISGIWPSRNGRWTYVKVDTILVDGERSSK